MNSTPKSENTEHEQYDYYSLDMSDYSPALKTGTGYTLLAEDHELVVTPQIGQVTLVNWERRRFVTDCLLSAQECAVLLLLLEVWPSYAPTERLLEAVQAHAAPTHDQHDPSSAPAGSLSHLHALLAHCQERLHALGLDVIPVGDLGVLLIHFQQPADDREEQETPLDGDHECGSPARPPARETDD